MKAHVALTVPIVTSARVQQLLGVFDLPPSQRSDTTFDVELPVETREWAIGLIVGPSGSGKSTIAHALFDQALVRSWRWPQDKSIIDSFPSNMSIKEIIELLSSVGFSSPPSWLRPFHALSNGEQFRVSIAHALAQQESLICVDEFSSVVDRTVAQVCSAAVAKTVRRRKQQLIAVSCHYDIIDWLQPDWVYDAGVRVFQWRVLQRRPSIVLTIRRVHKISWRIFKHHHYLSQDLSLSSVCFLATWRDRPVAFTAVIAFPHAVRSGWREHRTVCLPDFQGVGIGNAMSAYVGGLFLATGKPYFSTTSNPAMVHARARSSQWRMSRDWTHTAHLGTTSSLNRRTAKTMATERLTAGFEYVGPSNYHDALRFGLSVMKS